MKVRSHDPEEAIRHDVIVTIITAAKRDLTLVNDQLLGFVRERTLDKRVRSGSFALPSFTMFRLLALYAGAIIPVQHLFEYQNSTKSVELLVFMFQLHILLL